MVFIFLHLHSAFHDTVQSVQSLNQTSLVPHPTILMKNITSSHQNYGLLNANLLPHLCGLNI